MLAHKFSDDKAARQGQQQHAGPASPLVASHAVGGGVALAAAAAGPSHSTSELAQHQPMLRSGHVIAISKQLHLPTAGGHPVHTAAAAASAAAAAAAASTKLPAQPAQQLPTTVKPQRPAPAPPKVLPKGNTNNNTTTTNNNNNTAALPMVSEGTPDDWPVPPPERPALLSELRSHLTVKAEQQAILSQAYSGCSVDASLPAGSQVSGSPSHPFLLNARAASAAAPTSPVVRLSSFKKRLPEAAEPQQHPAAGEAAVVVAAADEAAAKNGSHAEAPGIVANARAVIGTALAERCGSGSHPVKATSAARLPLLPVKPPKVPEPKASEEKPAAVAAAAAEALARAPLQQQPDAGCRTAEDPQLPVVFGKKQAAAPPLPSKPKPGSVAVNVKPPLLPPQPEAPVSIASAAAAAVTVPALPATAQPAPIQRDSVKDSVVDSSGTVFAMLPFNRDAWQQSTPLAKPASMQKADDVQLPLVLWIDGKATVNAAQLQQQQASVMLRRAAGSSGRPSPHMTTVSLIEPTTEAEEYDDCFGTSSGDGGGPTSQLLSPLTVPPPRPGVENRALPPVPGASEISKVSKGEAKPAGDNVYDDTGGSLYDDTTSDTTLESTSTVNSDGKGATSAAQKEAKQREREEKRREKEEQEQRDREAREQARDKERRDKELDKVAKVRQALQKDQDKIRKKFKLSGDETYVRLVTMKVSYMPKPGKEELPYQAAEVLFVVLKKGCPKGKWLARNSDNLLGLIDCDQVVSTSVSSEVIGLKFDSLYDDAGRPDELENDDVYAEAD